MNRPVLSIITVNLNNSQGLKCTIKSVEQQLYNSYEHIIIDGGSTDESKDIIAKYTQRSSKLAYWISEPDRGIYDGMNKGIQQASGEYLYFLNSGDYLSDNILAQIPWNKATYIAGDVMLVKPQETINVKSPDVPNIIFFLEKSLPHQACFIHRNLFKEGGYSTDYKIISDWIHSVQSIVFENSTYVHVSLTIATCDGSGLSSDFDKTQKERIKWFSEVIPNPIYTALLELIEVEKSEFRTLIPVLNKTRKFQKRAKKIVLFLYKINNLFSRQS